MSTKACFSIAMGTGYFFNRNKYIRADGIQIGKGGEHVATGPTPIINVWGSLRDARFDSVDAILKMGNGIAYFFSGTNYVRVDGIQLGKATDRLAAGPHPISSSWPSLKQAGFETVDAVLPMGGGVAYFFSGTRYIRVGGIQPGRGGDTLEAGPYQIAEHWGSLKKAGFYSVDAVFGIGDSVAYFFSGSQYVRVDGIVLGAGGDTLAVGPNQIYHGWTSLRGFW